MAVVLVTGGAGYIGSFTCKALLETGHHPITYDNLSTGHRQLVQGDLVVGDTRDRELLCRVMRERKVEAVMHFAANILARESVVQPAKYYEVNVEGMIGLLEACRSAGVSLVVFSSTCAIYGAPRYLPLDESHPQEPLSPYGRTKLICEWLLSDYAAAYGIRYVALRYFNAAGGDSDGRLGEWHEPETHLIPRALDAAALGKSLPIYGTEHDTPDGTCIRDYIHVEDLARAHVLALEHLLGGGGSLQLNLGTGLGHSVRQVIDAVERVVGRPVRVEAAPAQPGDPPRLVADPSRARRTLGFDCKWLDLDEIIESAWRFHRNLIKQRHGA